MFCRTAAKFASVGVAAAACWGAEALLAGAADFAGDFAGVLVLDAWAVVLITSATAPANNGIQRETFMTEHPPSSSAIRALRSGKLDCSMSGITREPKNGSENFAEDLSVYYCLLPVVGWRRATQSMVVA